MSKKEEEEYESFTETVLNSALIGIIGYAALLGSTLLASGVFGIPKFIKTAIPYERLTWIDETKIGNRDILMPFRWIVKIIIFFLASIIGFFYYFCWMAPKSVWEDTIDTLSTGKNEWYYDNAKNFLSMVVFTCWFMLFYRSIVQYNTVEKIIEEDPILDDSNPKDITRE